MTDDPNRRAQPAAQALPSITEQQSKWGRLYTAANALVVKMGFIGSMQADSTEMESLKDKLHDLDGGEWMPGLMPPAQPAAPAFTWPAKSCPCGSLMSAECIATDCKWQADPSLVPESKRIYASPSVAPEPTDDVIYQELTDAECDEFRRHYGDFNSMIRLVHSDGHNRHAGRLIQHLGAVFNARFDAALAAHQPRAPLSPWQPMKTAPKDGTTVLVLLDASDIPHSARWLSGPDDRRATEETTRAGWHLTWDGSPIAEHDGPRYWMHCPDDPDESDIEAAHGIGEKP